MSDETNTIKKKVGKKIVVDGVAKIPKKRGRKPKGGKIIQTDAHSETNNISNPNVILHLKCCSSELKNFEHF